MKNNDNASKYKEILTCYCIVIVFPYLFPRAPSKQSFNAVPSLDFVRFRSRSGCHVGFLLWLHMSFVSHCVHWLICQGSLLSNLMVVLFA